MNLVVDRARQRDHTALPVAEFRLTSEVVWFEVTKQVMKNLQQRKTVNYIGFTGVLGTTNHRQINLFNFISDELCTR